MNRFGFSLSKGRQINYDTNDRSAAEYVIAGEPSLLACIECGGCASTCTSGNFTSFSLRQLNILLKRGENDSLRDELRKCMLCGKCTLVCPRGVNTRNVILLAMEAFNKSQDYAV
ncbi:MAG: 4Fe-4S dicluster domain-containing protein [Bacteroidales bacterium]|jgi:heterodisulfide reductase subunit B|nr:4Fe-4S dicluster domain-containing protein [Bacteroidales bacterium]